MISIDTCACVASPTQQGSRPSHQKVHPLRSSTYTPPLLLTVGVKNPPLVQTCTVACTFFFFQNTVFITTTPSWAIKAATGKLSVHTFAPRKVATSQTKTEPAGKTINSIKIICYLTDAYSDFQLIILSRGGFRALLKGPTAVRILL